MISCKNIILGITISISFSVFSQVKKENKLLIGRIDLSNKNYQQAIESFTTAITNNPLNYEGYYYRAVTKTEIGDFIGALSDINRAIELEPRNPELYILRGTLFDQQSNYYSAFEDYNKALNFNNKNPDVYISRAISYLNTENFTQAKKDCELAIRYKSRREMVFIIRGMAELGLKNYEEAINDFNLVLENNPSNAQNYVRRATAYFYLDSLNLSMKDLGKAISLDSKNLYAYFQRSMIYYKQNKTDEALADLNRLIDISPNSSNAYYNRALIYAEKKNFKAALKDYDKVLNINNKNILAHYNRALILQNQKRYKEALAGVEKTISIYPDFVDGYKLRAAIKQALGDYKGAEIDNQTAQIINQSKINIPDSLKKNEELLIAKVTSFNSGNSTYGSSEYSKTNQIALLPFYSIQLVSNLKEKRIIDSWNKTKESYSSYFLVTEKEMDFELKNSVTKWIEKLTDEIKENPIDAEPYLKRAIQYQTLGETKNSESDYKTSLQLDSSNYISYFCIANFLKESKTNSELAFKSTVDLKPILDLYAKCIQLNPSFSFAYFNRGHIHFEQEKYTDAIDDFSAAIKANPLFAEAYFNRALLLLILENRELACKDLSKAGELGLSQAYEIIAKYCN